MQGFAAKHFFDTNLVCLPRQQQAHFAFAVVLCLPVFLFLCCRITPQTTFHSDPGRTDPDVVCSDPHTILITDCRFSAPGAPSWIQAGPARIFYLAIPIQYSIQIAVLGSRVLPPGSGPQKCSQNRDLEASWGHCLG